MPLDINPTEEERLAYEEYLRGFQTQQQPIVPTEEERLAYEEYLRGFQPQQQPLVPTKEEEAAYKEYLAAQEPQVVLPTTAIGVAERTAAGAKREITDVFEITKILAPAVANDVRTFLLGTPEEQNKLGGKRLKQALEVAKQSPELMAQALEQSARTFGVTGAMPGGEPIGFDPRTAAARWMDAPIESLSDAFIVTGLAKGLAKAGAQSAYKVATKEAKQGFKKILKKKDLETKELTKIVSDKKVNTLLDDLYDESDILKDMSVGSQLDNPNFVEKVGKQAVDKINRLAKRDKIKLDSAIKKIKDTDVNKNSMSLNIANKLDEQGFLKSGTRELDVDNLEPGLSKGILKKEIEFLNSGDNVTAGALKRRIDNLDGKINWKAPKSPDKGLMEVRKVYRNELAKMSPEFDAKSIEVSEKLSDFESKIKSFKKVGAGEKFGKLGFQTKEEFNKFIDVLEKSDDRIAGQAIADVKALKAWHAWNTYFKQNPDFIFGEVPLLTPKLIPGIKKYAIKTSLGPASIAIQAAKSTTKPVIKEIAKGPKSKLVRGLLEVEEARESEKDVPSIFRR